MLHLWNIYRYIYHKLKPNVGNYSRPMEHMGWGPSIFSLCVISVGLIWITKKSWPFLNRPPWEDIVWSTQFFPKRLAVSTGEAETGRVLWRTWKQWIVMNLKALKPAKQLCWKNGRPNMIQHVFQASFRFLSYFVHSGFVTWWSCDWGRDVGQTGSWSWESPRALWGGKNTDCS